MFSYISEHNFLLLQINKRTLKKIVLSKTLLFVAKNMQTWKSIIG